MNEKFLSESDIDVSVDIVFKQKYNYKKLKEYFAYLIDEEDEEKVEESYRQFRSYKLRELRDNALKYFDTNGTAILSSEKKYCLATVLFLKDNFDLDVIHAPLVYEVMRVMGIVRDETDPAITSRLSLPTLQKLVRDGYLKYVDTEFEWKAVSGRPKYLFTLSSDDIKEEIKEFQEFKLLIDSSDKINKDERFKEKLEKLRIGYRPKD